MQGAGGVGGLLSTFNGGTDARMFYDGNGNVGQMVNGFNDLTVAVYEYDPFGNLVTSTGSFANMNPYKFSTKYLDAETGLYYYGYRFYHAEAGRWVNRDPIRERGGINLYAYVENDPVNRWDLLGLACIKEISFLFGSAEVNSSTTPEPNHTISGRFLSGVMIAFDNSDKVV